MSTPLAAVLVAALLAIAFQPHGCSAQTALQVALAAKEVAVSRLAKRGESAHSGRCATLASCLNGQLPCTTPACGNTFPESRNYECTNKFGTNPVLCGDNCPGMTRSITDTVVRIPPDTFFSDPEVQAFMCSTSAPNDGLNKEFQAQYDNGNGPLKAWSYVGHESGAIRIFPGNPQDRTEHECSRYDTRLRPWYLAASNGPKDVVIIIDMSDSMDWDSGVPGKSRLDLVRPAVVALLDTLTQNDFVNLVLFGTNARVLSGSALLRADAANIAKLKELFLAANTMDRTHFAPAFQKAFALFTANPEYTSHCTRVILFLTDGQAQDDPLDTIVAGQATLRAQTVNSKEAHVFTFSMTRHSDDTLPQAIACANNGVWSKIHDAENPLSKMSAYYQFLATGIDDSTVRWTTPYIDAFGLGEMVSAAVAMYDRSNTVPVLIGAAGVDVTIEELLKYTSSGATSAIVGELIARSSTCPTLNLTQCQMQHLREKQGFRCSAPAPDAATCALTGEIVTVPKCTAVGELNDYFCEPLDSVTRMAKDDPPASNGAVSCCPGNSKCNGASALSPLVALSIAVCVLLVTLGM